jgi:hypothetical protein
MRLTKNYKATQYKESDVMVSITHLEPEKQITFVTDMIFGENHKLKAIKSELSKDELIKELYEIVDRYYERYGS